MDRRSENQKDDSYEKKEGQFFCVSRLREKRSDAASRLEATSGG